MAVLVVKRGMNESNEMKYKTKTKMIEIFIYECKN